MSDQNVQLARAWTLRMVGGCDHLPAIMLKGLLASKSRYTAVKDLPEKDFLDGLYLGLCDWFNDGFDIEDLSGTSRALLGLPLLAA